MRAALTSGGSVGGAPMVWLGYVGIGLMSVHGRSATGGFGGCRDNHYSTSQIGTFGCGHRWVS